MVSAGDAVEDAVTALMCRGFGAQALGVVSCPTVGARAGSFAAAWTC